MNIMVDSSSLINVIKGNCVDQICQLKDMKYYIGNIVIRECSVDEYEKRVINGLIKNGKLISANHNVPLKEFLKIKNNFKIGNGESESIALCNELGFSLLCDDRKARECGKKILGKEKVFGSLYLLKRCVDESMMECTQANNFYREMESKGGFLPDLEKTYFCSN